MNIDFPLPPLVVHVIHALRMGGMENGLINLINRADPDRYRHAIVCVDDTSDFAQRIRRPGVEIVALHRDRIGTARLYTALYRTFRRMRPAIVHSRNLSGLDALVPALTAGVRVRIHGEHGRDVNDVDGSNRKLQRLRRTFRPFVSHYITVSGDLECYLVQRIGVAPARITQICNGVDTERFAPPDAQRPREMMSGVADSQSVVIGTVGRIQAVKNQLLLVRAFAALRERVDATTRARLRLALVGDGPMFDDARALVHQLRLAEVTWLPGARNDVPEILRALDVFVLPSLDEGISNGILEAMASGLPVVATRVGGNAELVQESRTGSLVPSDNVDAMAAALARYVTSPDTLREHGQFARQVALSQHSLDTMVNRYLGLYDMLHARRGARAGSRVAALKG